MSSKRPPPKPARSSEPKSLRSITKQGPFELPPVPKPPRKFGSEPPTKQKNVTASVYQSLISVFDTMTPAERMEFVDLAAAVAALEPGARRDLVELMVHYPQLWAADRQAVYELVERLATQSTKRK